MQNCSVSFTGPAKFQLDDVRAALSLCTHLVYGYAHINSDFEIVPGSPSLDTGSGYSYYRLATQLKRSFPDLKIYLSVGGNSDPYDEEHKYLVLVSTILLFHISQFSILDFQSVSDSKISIFN